MRRAVKATFTTIALTLGLMPLTAGVAHAAVTSVDAEPESANNQLPDNSHTITGTYTQDAGTDEPIRFIITAGPNADRLGNGANTSDGECTEDPAANTFTCTYTGFDATTPGTDTIRVFADNNENLIFDSGEPSDDVTKTFAGAPNRVVMTPDADQAAVGTCNPFTVTVRDAGGRPNPGAVIDVTLTERTPTDTQDVDFCTDAAPDATVPSTPDNQIDPGANPTPAGEPDHAEFVADENGQFTFGIISTEPGIVDVQAFSDTDGDDTFDTGEPNDTSVKTFVAGGAEGASNLNAEPENDTNFVGEEHTITATLTNASGDTIAGVTPEADITSGPNAAVDPFCGPTDQAGNATCTYTGTEAGTDTIVVFVNQASGATPGPDDGEPQDTVRKTYVAGAAGTQIDITCEGTVAGGSAAGNGTEEDCINPTDDSTEVFTATVTDAGGDPISGALVRFTADTTGGNTSDDDATVAPAECITGADGTCSTTLSNPNPADGDFVTVTATTANNTGPVPDSGTKTWQERAATNVVVTPPVDTNQAGSSHTVTATVTDQFGAPVDNTNVDFFVIGRNNLSGLDRETDANGNTTFTYADTGPTASDGDDVITAFADLNDDDNDNVSNAEGDPSGQADKFWINESTDPADVEIDMEDCDATFGPDPFTPADNDATADPNPVGGTHEVCAIVRSSEGDPLLGTTVTFRSTGVGHFASADDPDHTDLGTTTTAVVEPGGNARTGVARVFLHSNQIGTQTVTATGAGGQSDSGTKEWFNTPADARVITLTPEAATNAPGTVHQVTATVTDRFGNPVEGVEVTLAETGIGRFTTGSSTVVGLTNAAGQISAETTTLATETGTQTITATITSPRAPGSPNDQCEFGANQQPDDTNDPADADSDPDVVAGLPAGVCVDTATKTWEVAAEQTTTTTQPGATTTTTQPGATTTTTTPGGGTGPQAAGEQGYTLVAADGGIFNFGSSRFFGSTGALKLNQPIVGMDHTPTTNGYWLVASDGGIFAFGDARFFGSTGAITLNRPIVGMRSTPTGNGYWLVASDGGIFAFGDAVFRGSTGAIKLNQPIVGMDRTPTGNGYWLVAADGGIFAFGDARFFGSTGAITLNRPIVGMARTNSGSGYHLVASDGGIFAFGDAVFRGSTGAITLNSPIEDIMPTSSGGGYWLCARDGGVFAFGNARFLGSMGATRLNLPVVGCDAPLSQGGTSV